MAQASMVFIGAGNMATSIISGLLQSGYTGPITATDPDQDKLNQLASGLDIQTTTDNNEGISGADVVILAVKPQVMKSVCQGLVEAVQQSRPLIISIAAGLESETIEQWLGGNLAVIRCMPNTPALVQTGASGLYANTRVSDDQKNLAEMVFNAVGISIWVEKEHHLHAVTATSGSGPAYFFMFMEAMQKSAESLGLSADVAAKLVGQTALGAAQMVLNSGDSAETLRKKVCSPNGTTERAIRSFEQDGLRAAVQQAMIACADRSEEMARELASGDQ
ncbi:pyrroline-5-carboxylate reductase [Gynuella sunshinyii]|uniref:Pyrroline-5-carboxylate reductase n=1 Tax=Gynuella sunshinyii YC6258 TaxID=1445510 RepID=A0A0C5VFG8_9GAMM|nr:pyrroline-5-carboxylate reductase [Gynuella sunshinyii]AJQ92921.1 pyrroline-5-carboxylate reductase [Gynuella sunshinyii YC6258]